MIRQNSDRIINIASMYGMRASMTGTIPGYWAGKRAIPQLTRGWAWEFAPHNITVNAIAPGFFLTELMPGDDSLRSSLPRIGICLVSHDKEKRASGSNRRSSPCDKSISWRTEKHP